MQESEEPSTYRSALSFLKTLSVDVDTWVGSFTANTKMVRYMQKIKAEVDPSRFIYHLDLDEFPGMNVFICAFTR
jgi:hypothetical protein